MLRSILRISLVVLNVLLIVIIYWALHILNIEYGHLLALACSGIFVGTSTFLFRARRNSASWLLLIGSIALFLFDLHEATIFSMLQFGWLDKLSQETQFFVFPTCTENPRIAVPFGYTALLGLICFPTGLFWAALQRARAHLTSRSS